MAGRHVEIREIDYAEVLRERKGGEAAAWDQVIANCLQGDAFELNEETIRALLDAAADSEKLAQLMATLDARAAETGRTVAQRTTALLRLLQGIVQAVSEREPERVDPMLRNLAGAAGRLSPEMLVSLLSQRDHLPHRPVRRPPRPSRPTSPRLSRRWRAACPTRPSRSSSRRTPSPRGVHRLGGAGLSRPRPGRRLSRTPHHDGPRRGGRLAVRRRRGFERTWETVAEKMITSYSDEPFVSDAYARELSTTRSERSTSTSSTTTPRSVWPRGWALSQRASFAGLDLTLVLDLILD